MTRIVLGAPSALGLSPSPSGGPRGVDRAPAVMRSHGLVQRLSARDRGDVVPAGEYVDLERPTDRCRNEQQVAAYSRELGSAVARAVETGFALVIGGDCSILLGALLGLRRASAGQLGLVYVDAHADFGTLAESGSGSACSMNLALVTGRAEQPLAHLDGAEPLLQGERIVHVGRRDDDPQYGSRMLSRFGIAEFAGERPVTAPEAVASDAIARLAGCDGFWIHFDVDVLDPTLMPAVDSPVAGGLQLDQAATLLRRLASDPRALGLQLTVYDPSRDPDESCAERLVTLLEQALVA